MIFSPNTLSVKKSLMSVETSEDGGKIRYLFLSGQTREMTQMFQIAAQNCRKRKVDQIFNLEEDLAMVRHRKKIILSERAELLRQEQEVRRSLNSLERRILIAAGKTDESWNVSIDENNGKVAFAQHSL